MKNMRQIKQKVCYLFLAIGISLATIHEAGGYTETAQAKADLKISIKTLFVVKS